MTEETSAASSAYRWLQLLAGVCCMVMVANLQYGWTYFVDPMDQAHHWGREGIQLAFSLFIATETWLVPVEAWFVDKFGPRLVIAFGGIVVAIAWALNSVADSLPMLYLGAILSGIGAGAVYGTCVGNALKWFPDRRGLAAGLTAAGFGAGAALTVYPIITTIQSRGYQAAFLWFGLGQGIVILLLALYLRAPRSGQVPQAAARVSEAPRDFTPAEMLRSPIFYLMYVMFVLVAASGLVVTAQVAPIARDYKIATTNVDLVFLTSTVLVAAGVIDNILNGLARPTFGWISDHIGRENTMAIAFGIGAAAYWLLGAAGTAPWAFVLFAALIFLTWGEIFSLFPSTCTDSFGPKFATVNLSLLYTAKGASAFLVPVANMIKASTGGWHMVFAVTAIMNESAVPIAIPLSINTLTIGITPAALE